MPRNARNWLKTEGVPGRDIALEVLKPTGPIPPTVEAELEALSVDPLVLGNVRKPSRHSFAMARPQFWSAR